MLEPRETDIPALFLVFVVLPLVTYILLGKWSKSTKKKRVSLLTQQAAEESLGVEAMTATTVVPVLCLPNNSESFSVQDALVKVQLVVNGASLFGTEINRTKDAGPSQGSNGVTGMGIMKMIGFMKPSKLERLETSEVNSDQHKKVKMLFPYEDFVKFFQYEVFNMSPRGLINCGNSCYANAVLQCLTSTKPLLVFLLQRLHSRACYDWFDLQCLAFAF
ncbi:ubiquitin carboxyl-terminal hydrolase 15-like [Coffea eugenioides]|uniref:ubiquitin carboxyl-terminal hydrolase 15-like n=1 Tax=Coffea eugenioides TaxID=49369 RepID=UPI000F606612|nr:ubiquitin carboxyl-terminal hydrolase 15-like [Coffea eugenioides]